MEFLDHIKDDYMVLRKCIGDKFLKLVDDANFIYICRKNRICYNIQLENAICKYIANKPKLYWKEMAELDFELNNNNLKITSRQLKPSEYEFFCNIDINLKPLDEYWYLDVYIFISTINSRLEIFTYDYDKIREAKLQLNKEILEESQKKICDPRFINPGWDDLQKEIDEYFDNH
jgi:hypothetical protein